MAVYDIPPLGPGWHLQALVARYRFSETISREMVALLEDAYRRLAQRLQGLDVLDRRDRNGLEDRFLEVRRLLDEAYGTAQRTVTATVREYAALELEIANRQLQALAAVQRATTAGALVTTTAEMATVIGAPGAVSVVTSALPRQLVVSAARLNDIVERVDVGGIGFGEWWVKARDDGIARVRRVIQTGVVQGQHPTEIARRIWASRTLKGPNAWRQSRTVAETVARTVVTAVQTEAQLTTEAQFPNVIRGYVFRAVLDSRTSDICRSLADTEWKAGDPRMPVPPLHPNCRSTLEPIVDVPGIGRTTSHQPTYEQWLRTQPPRVQDLIIGKGVAEHWRAGQTRLADLLSVDRRPMTLAQLRQSLVTAQPESYIAWVSSLPDASLRAVLGPTLAREVRSGRASIADVLRQSAASGIVGPVS